MNLLWVVLTHSLLGGFFWRNYSPPPNIVRIVSIPSEGNRVIVVPSEKRKAFSQEMRETMKPIFSQRKRKNRFPQNHLLLSTYGHSGKLSHILPSLPWENWPRSLYPLSAFVLTQWSSSSRWKLVMTQIEFIWNPYQTTRTLPLCMSSSSKKFDIFFLLSPFKSRMLSVTSIASSLEIMNLSWLSVWPQNRAL